MRKLFAVGLLFAGIHAEHCAAQPVLPFVDCVDFDAATNQVTAWFSYANGTGATVFVAGGSGNFFTPAPVLRDQPTSFVTGVQRKVFSATFPADSTLTWTVQGSDAVAANDSTAYCYHEYIFVSDFEH
jgi:hypothetical protein